MIKAPGKRSILPKIISSQANSMSQKNVSNSEIFLPGHTNSSKGKVVSRIVYLDANTAKKILPTKPKILLAQDTTQSQIDTVEANNTSRSQALIADAELKTLIPARNLVEYVSAPDNYFNFAGITIKENYGTKKSNNVNNTEHEYYNENKDNHQGVCVLPGRQLLNQDPFLSDTNSIELINDINELNKVSTQEDSEKDQIIVEGYIPVASNNTMDDSDILFTWGADSLLNDNMPVPIDSMMMVSPLTVEGKSLALEDTTSESSTTEYTIDNQSVATPQPNIEDIASETEMNEVMEHLDEEFLASILNDIEISSDESTILNDVPEEKDDLLKMVMDDSIGQDIVAQFCNVDFLTLNTQDISESRENEAMCTSASDTQEATVNIVDANVAPTQKRGPGRPKKLRTTEKVTKPRGRPARVHLSPQNVMADHHNYSNGGASNSKLSTDERRYRRMRDLNNVASQRCRLKRKYTTQGAFEDLKQEEEKNRELSMKVRLLEEQVAALKKHFIKRIANPRSVATTSAAQVSQWDINQLEKFVDDAANKHLGK
jgi:hypothetical protein